MIIRRQTTPLNVMMKVLPVVITVLFFLTGILINPLFLIAGMAMILADMWLLPRQNVEYEYSYVNGELDIAEIYSKKIRKEVAVFDMKSMEIMAPVSSDALTDYRKLPQIDYTSGRAEDRKNAWAFVISVGGTKKLVLFSPNQTMLEDLRIRNASKFRKN
jgi:hypothetical protein